MPAEMTCADKVLREAGSLIVSTSTAPRRSVNSSEGMRIGAPVLAGSAVGKLLHSRNCVTQRSSANRPARV